MTNALESARSLGDILSLAAEWLAAGFLAAGVIFTIGGLIGLFRFPDPYSRLQAGSLAGTTGAMSFFIAGLLMAPTVAMALRIFIIIVFFLLSSPTGGHIVARFTWNSGIQPWRPRGVLRSGDRRGGAPPKRRRRRGPGARTDGEA